MRIALLLITILTTSACSSLGGLIIGTDQSGHSADYFATLNKGEDVEFTSFGGETNKDQLEQKSWPLENADMYLDVAEPGEVIKTLNYDGNEAEFVVAAQYRSASKKLCKNYYVNQQNYLACFNPHWNPVRLFNE